MSGIDAGAVGKKAERPADERKRRAVVYADGARIRKLTPVECERLQGFSDGWTEYGADGRKMSDSARYKALGNTVTVNFPRMIGEKLR